MLKELYIENLAVIERAGLSFGGRFTVFTGETGAGKSILINGINAILGQRVTKDIVRTGAAKAVISGLFTDLDKTVTDELSELGIDCPDGELTLTREISSDGGSVARIDNRPVNISLMRQIGGMLVNIHGQHDNQILLSPDRHIEILDSYADSDELLNGYRESFKQLQQTARKLKKAKAAAGERARRLEELREIYNEITALNITDPEEETRISAELEVAKNVVAISEAVYGARMILTGDDETSGAFELAFSSASELERYASIAEEIAPLYERVNSAAIELQDVAGELERVLDRLDVDPKRFDQLVQRADELRKICRKYGPELSDVMKKQEDAARELEELEGTEQSLKTLRDEMEALLSETTRRAKELSAHRQAAAERFVSEVTEELSFLNMPNVKIVVDIKAGKLTVNGLDNVEFLISANLGEEPRPIAKIASGGELSRIMLALRNVIAGRDPIGTFIFDEIDTGVSGRAAQKIGMKLRQISRLRQVLCVTHLAQIAVMADDHMLIEKNVEGDRTVTSVKPLDHEERKLEIARIIGGDNTTELMLENAEEMLRAAAESV